MIPKLHIEGYQSLGDVTLELGRITIITGDSDQGKTAITRAVEQAGHNDGSGDVLTVHHGEAVKRAEVRFDLEDDVSVTWGRTAKSSDYRVAGKGESQEFKKLKSTVPDEVQAALGMREVQIDSGSGPTSWSRLQFMGQFDQPFLLVDRGGVAAARILGRLTGVHVFAEAGKLARQDGTALQARKVGLEAQVREVAAEVETYADVEPKIAILEQIEVEARQAAVVAGRHARLVELQDGLRMVDGQLAEIGFDPFVAEQRLEDAKRALQHVWRLVGQLAQVAGIETRLTGIEAQIERDREMAKIDLVDPAAVAVGIQRVAHLGALETQLRGLEAQIWKDGRLAAIDLTDPRAMAGAVERVAQLRVLEGGAARMAEETAEAEAVLSGEERGLDELAALRERFDREVPLCPFVGQFDGVPAESPYRCDTLRQVQIRKRSAG